MTIERRTSAFEDARGSITDVLTGTVCSVTLVTCKSGAIRGNHYHKFTTVWVYILTGRFNVRSQVNGAVESAIASVGDLLTFPPKDLHALQALEDSSFLIMADGMRGGNLTVQEKLL